MRRVKKGSAARAQDHDTPYHPGELRIQRRVDVSEDAARVGRIIGGTLTAPVRQFLAERETAIAASLDGAGQVWASLLTGPPGFLRAWSDDLLLIEGTPGTAVELTENLSHRPELGLLAIDLAHRSRLRVNGRGLAEHGRIYLVPQQVYGNCPKYIRPRRVRPVGEQDRSPRRSTTLDPRQREWIASADCLFVASYHPEGGADASHRGGEPGFVKVLGPSSLSFPDYPGNSMFNTLGNIAEQRRVGLLFLDFERGATLQLTGRATVEWPAGGRAEVSFEADLIQETRAGVIGRPIVEGAADER
jgi:predicted pyridoxine 5'-phosphate oxidase superfamily flavin-nucleotide-binding protein